ncbi:MAG: hypothetical protein BWZ10_02498 [candidate division BRC1 bacterium ADurb.BinA364]|nr:MAG: hypothetical protein BWZ10_02498 [candidate division BRC1 bacterium ADurb.BinA364]
MASLGAAASGLSSAPDGSALAGAGAGSGVGAISSVSGAISALSIRSSRAPDSAPRSCDRGSAPGQLAQPKMASNGASSAARRSRNAAAKGRAARKNAPRMSRADSGGAISLRCRAAPPRAPCSGGSQGRRNDTIMKCMSLALSSCLVALFRPKRALASPRCAPASVGSIIVRSSRSASEISPQAALSAAHGAIARANSGDCEACIHSPRKSIFRDGACYWARPMVCLFRKKELFVLDERKEPACSGRIRRRRRLSR